MNAVLQSLSNIQEFSCYFNTLPSLEGKNNGRRVYHSRSYKEVQDVVMAEELRKVCFLLLMLFLSIFCFVSYFFLIIFRF